MLNEKATEAFVEVAKDVVKDRSKDLYDDGFKPFTTESGKALAIIPQTVNAIFADLSVWNIQREAKILMAQKEVEIKLHNMDAAKISAPESYVAIPTLEAVSYSMDREELRDLYTNLLAKSMYEDTKDHVHPMFVEIIKQMSPLDAKIFKIIMEREENPLIDLGYERTDGSFTTIESNVSDIDIAPAHLVSLSIDNLAKQNLISIAHDKYCEDDELYKKILNSKFYAEQKASHPDKEDGSEFTYDKHLLHKTNIGKAFYDICMTQFH